MLNYRIKKSHFLVDWHGRFLNAKCRKTVNRGWIVRVLVSYSKDGKWIANETLYVKVTKIKGIFVSGKVLGEYRIPSLLRDSLPNGRIITFGRGCIAEIPIQWNPERYRSYLVNNLETKENFVKHQEREIFH